MGSSTMRKILVTGGAGSSAHPVAHNRLRILFCTLGYEPGPAAGPNTRPDCRRRSWSGGATT